MLRSRRAASFFAVAVLLVGCASAPGAPPQIPSPTADGGTAAPVGSNALPGSGPTLGSNPCTDGVNAPDGTPSMMPPESGAPPEANATYFPPEWPPTIDVAACTQAIEALRQTAEFSAGSGGHQVEFGGAAPYADGKDPLCHREVPDQTPCWAIDFYDYERRAGFRALVVGASQEVAAIVPFDGVQASRAEADRAIRIALADAALTRAHGDGSAWSRWLIEPSPGPDDSGCRAARCISGRTWNSKGSLLFFVVDLHGGQLVEALLP